MNDSKRPRLGDTLRLAWVHFKLFHERKCSGTRWKVLWIAVWGLQSLRVVIYWGGTGLHLLSGMALVFVLFAVFLFGNRYSPRNNAFLLTRPIPRRTCFLADCALPFGLYMAIPLLGEIPLVLVGGLGLGNLLWAWLDALTLIGIIFIGIWLAGVVLPPIRRPLEGFAAGTLVLFVPWCVEQIPLGNHATDLFGAWGWQTSGTEWYFTMLLGTGLSVAILGFVLRFRLRRIASVAVVVLVVLPGIALSLRMGPHLVSRLVRFTDIHRAAPSAEDAGYELQCPSYQDRHYRNNPRNEPASWTYQFHIHGLNAPPGRVVVPRLLQSTAHWSSNLRDLHGEWGGRGLTSRVFLTGKNVVRQAEKGLVYSLLEQHYGDSWQPKKAPPIHSGFPVPMEVRDEMFDGIRDQLVRVNHRFKLHECDLTPLATGVPLRKDIRAKSRWGVVRIRNSRRWETKPHRGETKQTSRKFNIGATLRTRTINLFWKRLVRGGGEYRGIALVVRERNGDRAEVSLTGVPYHLNLKSLDAFPLYYGRYGQFSSRFRYPVEGDTKATNDEPIPDSGFRIQSNLAVDVFEFASVRQLQGTASEFLRFEGGGTKRNSQWVHLAKTDPLEVLRRLADGEGEKGYNPGLPSTLGRELGRRRPEEYKALLFEAAKHRADLAALIVNNGWHEEAMETWLDLARQRRALPPAAVKAFAMLGDPRLIKALKDHQRYAPRSEIFSLSRLYPAWHDEMAAITRQAAVPYLDEGLEPWEDYITFSNRIFCALWVAPEHLPANLYKRATFNEGGIHPYVEGIGNLHCPGDQILRRLRDGKTYEWDRDRMCYVRKEATP